VLASITKGLEGGGGRSAPAYHPNQRRDWIKIKNIAAGR
jgi:hypothetical protein